MTQRPRLVIVLSRFPYPLEKGDKLRAYYQIKHLALHFSIHLICVHEDRVTQQQRNALKPYCQEIHTVRIRKLFLPLRIVIGTLIKRFPLQVSYFYSATAKRKINALLDDIKPAVIYNQLIRTAPYTVHRSEPKVIDIMDAFSYGMSQRSLASKGLRRIIYRSESRLIRTYENMVIPEYNGKTIISIQDKLRSSHLDGSQIELVRNGVEMDRFKPIETQKLYDLVFVGNMGYAPNVEAAAFIVNEILPYYLAQYGKTLTVGIIGARPTPKVTSLQSDSVSVIGWVEDINLAYNQGKVFVAPIFHGIGQQNKLMEAMSCQLPCVVSPDVAAPFNAKHNQELLIAENVEEFVMQLNVVLEKRIDISLLKQNAIKSICNKYTWNQQTEPLIKILQDLV